MNEEQHADEVSVGTAAAHSKAHDLRQDRQVKISLNNVQSAQSESVMLHYESESIAMAVIVYICHCLIDNSLKLHL